VLNSINKCDTVSKGRQKSIPQTRMRKTQAREAIIDTLKKAKRPVTAREIIDAVADSRPDINKSTVYRFIKSLLASEQIVAIALPGKGSLYELRGAGSHHHFTCEKCQKVVCLGNSQLELKRMVPKGFAISPQHLVLSGLCARCS
jgi:Fur family ferric uptake transcriptional regulator